MRNQSEVAAVFDALGDPMRRAIVELLTAGPQPVGRLAEQLPVGRPAVSKHLRVLSDAGLVRHDSRGTRNLYALAPPGMVTAQQWLVAMWDSVLNEYAAAVRDVTGRSRTDGVDGRRRPQRQRTHRHRPAAETGADMAELPPIRRDILVEAAPDVAFAVFTDRIGSWWPLAELSVYGAGASVTFHDGKIVEAAPDRPDTVWGEITDWNPPDSIAFTWHPGAGPDRASRVGITFTARGEQTLVRLEHAGWETFADPAAARAEYDRGWPTVLDAYDASLRSSADPAPE